MINCWPFPWLQIYPILPYSPPASQPSLLLKNTMHGPAEEAFFQLLPLCEVIFAWRHTWLNTALPSCLCCNVLYFISDILSQTTPYKLWRSFPCFLFVAFITPDWYILPCFCLSFHFVLLTFAVLYLEACLAHNGHSVIICWANWTIIDKTTVSSSFGKYKDIYKKKSNRLFSSELFQNSQEFLGTFLGTPGK